MCGISGYLNLTGEAPQLEVLESMLQAIDHRGPDQRGIYRQGEVGLGMTRLSINDVEGGGQPY